MSWLFLAIVFLLGSFWTGWSDGSLFFVLVVILPAIVMMQMLARAAAWSWMKRVVQPLERDVLVVTQAVIISAAMALMKQGEVSRLLFVWAFGFSLWIGWLLWKQQRSWFAIVGISVANGLVYAGLLYLPTFFSHGLAWVSSGGAWALSPDRALSAWLVGGYWSPQQFERFYSPLISQAQSTLYLFQAAVWLSVLSIGWLISRSSEFKDLCYSLMQRVRLFPFESVLFVLWLMWVVRFSLMGWMPHPVFFFLIPGALTIYFLLRNLEAHDGGEKLLGCAWLTIFGWPFVVLTLGLVSLKTFGASWVGRMLRYFLAATLIHVFFLERWAFELTWTRWMMALTALVVGYSTLRCSTTWSITQRFLFSASLSFGSMLILPNRWSWLFLLPLLIIFLLVWLRPKRFPPYLPPMLLFVLLWVLSNGSTDLIRSP